MRWTNRSSRFFCPWTAVWRSQTSSGFLLLSRFAKDSRNKEAVNTRGTCMGVCVCYWLLMKPEREPGQKTVWPCRLHLSWLDVITDLETVFQNSLHFKITLMMKFLVDIENCINIYMTVKWMGESENMPMWMENECMYEDWDELWLAQMHTLIDRH